MTKDKEQLERFKLSRFCSKFPKKAERIKLYEKGTRNLNSYFFFRLFDDRYHSTTSNRFCSHSESVSIIVFSVK